MKFVNRAARRWFDKHPRELLAIESQLTVGGYKHVIGPPPSHFTNDVHHRNHPKLSLIDCGCYLLWNGSELRLTNDRLY